MPTARRGRPSRSGWDDQRVRRGCAESRRGGPSRTSLLQFGTRLSMTARTCTASPSSTRAGHGLAVVFHALYERDGRRGCRRHAGRTANGWPRSRRLRPPNAHLVTHEGHLVAAHRGRRGGGITRCATCCRSSPSAAPLSQLRDRARRIRGGRSDRTRLSARPGSSITAGVPRSIATLAGWGRIADDLSARSTLLA